MTSSPSAGASLRQAPAEIPIEVLKSDGQRYRSLLHRADGVIVELEGGSYNKVGGPAIKVPHDIAHFVVEDALGLDRGLWGVLAAGGIVQNARFVAGRKPPHALRRTKAITDAAVADLQQAEVVVRAVADLALAGGWRDPGAIRRATAEPWWPPVTDPRAVMEACGGLRAAAARWRDLRPGEAFRLTWRW